MSTSNNTVILTGNMTKDLELRFTNNGTPVANGRVAVTDRFTTRDGDLRERTTYVNFVLWGDLAMHAAESVGKGSHISLRGRLDIREYEVNGERRYSTEIVAVDIAPSLRWAAATVERQPVGVGAVKTDDRGEVYGNDSEPF